jgi:hypothetical protein
MKHPSRKLFISITTYCAIIFTGPVFAAQSDVLDINEIGNADISTLLEDTKTFNTIGMGIALSIAECHGKDICEPNVDEDEIGQLIETLDQRIEGVVSRQQNNEEELTPVITAYVDTKEKYADYLAKLSEISKPEPEVPQEEFVEEDIFTDEDALTEDEYSAFDDFEEDLEDDEDLDEFEDEYDPDEI